MNRTEELLRSGVARTSAHELMVATLGTDPFEKIEEIRGLGVRKAQAEGTAYQLDAERHIVLAELANEYANTHVKESLSEAKLDRLARSDHRYRKHIEGLSAAIEERELAKSEYFARRSELLWLEKIVSHENAMSKLGEPV